MVEVIQINVRGFDDNFSYLLVGEGSHSKEAIIVDPTGDLGEIEKALRAHGLHVVLQIFTHLHSDHTQHLGHFKKQGVPVFIPQPMPFGEVETIESVGEKLTIIHVPGHAKEAICILFGKNLITGDTLYVRGTGRTDFGGSDEELRNSISFLSLLDKELNIWPGHNYGGATCSLGEALRFAPIKTSKAGLEKAKKKFEKSGEIFG